MKNRIAFIVLGLTALWISNIYAAEFYQVDPSLSSVNFKVSHFGISFVRGQFKKFSGTLFCEGGQLTQFTGVVDMTSLDTGIRARDQDLKSDNFFATNRFPKMIVKSQKIIQHEQTITIQSDLTIRGVTKPIALHGELKQENSGKTLSLILEGVIGRKDFGLQLNKIIEFFVSDKVNISLKLKAQS